LSQFNNKERFS
jgi:hypothetical protein